MKQPLNERFKDLRKKNRLTQQELADRLGIKSKSTISEYESGNRKIPMDVIEAAADLYGINPAYILGYEMDERPAIVVSNDDYYVSQYRTLDAHGKEIVNAVIDIEVKRMRSAPPYTSANVHPGVTLPPVDQIADLKNAAFATDKTVSELNEDAVSDD